MSAKANVAAIAAATFIEIGRAKTIDPAHSTFLALTLHAGIAEET